MLKCGFLCMIAGNAAYSQVQLDIYGELMDTVYLSVSRSASVVDCNQFVALCVLIESTAGESTSVEREHIHRAFEAAFPFF